MKTKGWITGIAMAAALGTSGLIGSAWAQPGRGGDRDRNDSDRKVSQDRNQNRNQDRNDQQYRSWDGRQDRSWGSRRIVTYRPTHVAVRRLSPGRIAVRVGQGRFFYEQGRFYMRGPSGFAWVTAPIGARIPALPFGVSIIHSSGMPYYYFAGTYYVRDAAANGYTVVPPPQAADNFDTIVMTDGSSLTGHYLGGDESTIQFQVGGTIYDVDRADIVSLSLAQPNAYR